MFPKAGSPAVTGPQWSDCARKGLAVKAVRGNALLFYSLKPNGCAIIVWHLSYHCLLALKAVHKRSIVSCERAGCRNLLQ